MKRTNDQSNALRQQPIPAAPEPGGPTGNRPAAAATSNDSSAHTAVRPGLTSTAARTGPVFLPAPAFGPGNAAAFGPGMPAQFPVQAPHHAPLAPGAMAHGGYIPAINFQLPFAPPATRVQGSGSQAPAGWAAPVLQGAAPQLPATVAGHSLAPAGNRDVFQDQALLDRAKAAIKEGIDQWIDAALNLREPERRDFMIASLHGVMAACESDIDWLSPVLMIMHSVAMETLLAQKWPAGKGLVAMLTYPGLGKWLDQALATDAGRQLLFRESNGRWPPLHLAVRRCNKKAVRSILAHDDATGTLRMRQDNHGGRIALQIACLRNDAKSTGLLLEHHGREQRLAASSDGRLPIHSALGYGTGIDVLLQLLAECAVEQTLARPQRLNRNALMLAALVSAPAVRSLLAVKATLAEQLEARDANGLRAIDHARQFGNAEIISLIETAMQSRSNASSSSSTSTTTTAAGTIANLAARPTGNEGPVPMTPFPLSQEGEQAYDAYTEAGGPF